MKIVIYEVRRYTLPIIAFQEIRLVENGSIKSNDTTIFYSRGMGTRHEFT